MTEKERAKINEALAVLGEAKSRLPGVAVEISNHLGDALALSYANIRRAELLLKALTLEE